MTLQQVSTAKIAKSSLLEGLKYFAFCLGYVLAAPGWFFFWVGILQISSDAYIKPSVYLSVAAFFVTPGWLLLRLASGLFPFSRRFVK